MKGKKYLSLSIIGAVTLGAVACGSPAGLEDVSGSISTEGDLAESFGEDSALPEEAADSSASEGSVNGSSAEGKAAESEAAVQEEKPKPIERKLKELVLEEAIVVDDTSSDIFEGASGDEVDYSVNSANEELPESYISDISGEKDFVTPVKNQGYTNLCWAYSSISAVESDILIHHKDMDQEDLNLSEKHTAYYNMHKASGSYLGYIDEDYREFVFDGEGDEWIKDYDTSYVSVGGVTNYCLSVFTAWKGPVYDGDSNSIHVIKGQTDLYSKNGDAPTDAYEKPVCHVQGVYEVPATEKNRDFIKKLIMEHGSVTCSVCAADEYWTGHKTSLYDYKKYGPDNVADHEVVIVGWDDNYKASNFITKPDKDGAFVCKNSWGTKQGAGGYFYLSYEDSILNSNIVAAYDCALEGEDDWYDNNYQHAGFITHMTDAIVDQKNVVYAYEDSDAVYGALYEAGGHESLKAVGFFSMATDMDYEAFVYSLDDQNADEIWVGGLGEPVSSTKCHFITGGYHTIPLEAETEVKKGDRFLVVIRPDSKAKLLYEKAMDSTAEINYDDWKHDLGAIHTHNEASGMSFLSDETGEYLLKQTDKDFFIKAYTCNLDE